MARIDIDPALVKKYDEDVTTVNGTIDSSLLSLGSILDELRTNVTGSDVEPSIRISGEKLEDIRASLASSFSDLSAFLQSQMSGYVGSFEVANDSLRALLDQISTTNYGS